MDSGAEASNDSLPGQRDPRLSTLEAPACVQAALLAFTRSSGSTSTSTTTADYARRAWDQVIRLAGGRLAETRLQLQHFSSRHMATEAAGAANHFCSQTDGLPQDLAGAHQLDFELAVPLPLFASSRWHTTNGNCRGFELNTTTWRCGYSSSLTDRRASRQRQQQEQRQTQHADYRLTRIKSI